MSVKAAEDGIEYSGHVARHSKTTKFCLLHIAFLTYFSSSDNVPLSCYLRPQLGHPAG